jgi:dolichol-phosphate mannosyltransferase
MIPLENPPRSGAAQRVAIALSKRDNWHQLAKFALVGASGYVVNIIVYARLLELGIDYLIAAVGSFLVAVTNNYVWNRSWTFRTRRGNVLFQGLRFFCVSVLALVANLAVLHALVEIGGLGRVTAQAIAIAVVTPVNFVGNRLWSFRVVRPNGRRPAPE